MKLFLLLLLFISTSLYAQSDVEFVDSDDSKMEKLNINPDESIDNEQEFYKRLDKEKRFKKVKDLQAKAQTSGSIHSDADKKNLEALIEQVRKENSKTLKGFAKTNDANNDAEGKLDRQAFIKKFSKQSNKLKVSDFLKKGQSKKLMEKLLRPYRVRGYRSVHAFLTERFKGTPTGRFLASHPKVHDILTKLLIDKRALPSAVQVVEKRAQMFIFIVINIFIFILGFVLARFKKKFNFFTLQRLGYFVFRFVLIVGLRIGVLVYFFHKELDPIYQVISSSL